jgi:hypothetical protein
MEFIKKNKIQNDKKNIHMNILLQGGAIDNIYKLSILKSYFNISEKFEILLSELKEEDDSNQLICCDSLINLDVDNVFQYFEDFKFHKIRIINFPYTDYYLKINRIKENPGYSKLIKEDEILQLEKDAYSYASDYKNEIKQCLNINKFDLHIILLDFDSNWTVDEALF